MRIPPARTHYGHRPSLAFPPLYRQPGQPGTQVLPGSRLPPLRYRPSLGGRRVDLKRGGAGASQQEGLLPGGLVQRARLPAAVPPAALTAAHPGLTRLLPTSQPPARAVQAADLVAEPVGRLVHGLVPRCLGHLTGQVDHLAPRTTPQLLTDTAIGSTAHAGRGLRGQGGRSGERVCGLRSRLDVVERQEEATRQPLVCMHGEVAPDSGVAFKDGQIAARPCPTALGRRILLRITPSRRHVEPRLGPRTDIPAPATVSAVTAASRRSPPRPQLVVEVAHTREAA
eukprot:scaffold17617_cov98-Isochrysis_galbana.AAC.3